MERKAGRMLERSRRNERTPRKDAFIPNRKELRWPANATRFNPLFVKHEWSVRIQMKRARRPTPRIL